MYRIPLKDFTEKVGDPSLATTEYIRFFVTGFDTTVRFRIAEFNLVGSQWQKAIQTDTILAVSVVNVEENPGYTIPPGVGRERDRTRPDENILRNEQSMNLIVNGLEPAQSREAVKYLVRPLDVFNYKQMKLFVHGDTNPEADNISNNEGGARAEVYFRFGADSNNYYEYRQPIVPDWGEIAIPFAELTTIKEGRDSAATVNLLRASVPDKPGHSYGVKGNPSLTNVKYLTVGILNLDNPDRPRHRALSGQVWINELRVISADDTPGWAYTVSGSLKMADFLTFSFNLSETNPYFHKISDRFGSRNESKNWGISTDVDLLKLLPFKWEDSNLRLNYSHNETYGKPLYVPGTDVLASKLAESSENPDQIISETESVNISDTWSSSSIKLKLPSNWWLIRDTWNALTFGFNYNKTSSRSPTVLSNAGWIWNASVNYGVNFSPDFYIKPADIPIIGAVFGLLADYRNTKIYFAPQNFAFNINARRNRNTNTTRERRSNTSSIATPSQTVITRDFGTQRGFNFAWRFTEGGFFNISTTYNVNISSSLAHLETEEDGITQRPEREIWREIFTSAFFGKPYQYQQNIDFRSAPRLPSLWDINKYFTITAGYSVGYQWQQDLKNEVLGRGAGFANKTTFGLSLRLKALSAPLFEDAPIPNNKQNTQGNRNTPDRNKPRERRPSNLQGTDSTMVQLPDSLAAADSTELEETDQVSAIEKGWVFIKSVIHFIFFDYENITFNFSTDNSLSKSGIHGTGTGFKNFWGVAFNENNGPSRGFMFGLSQNVGTRAPGGNLSDVSSNKNNFDFKTSRPLWEGAKIDLNWKVNWSTNKTINIITDSLELGRYTMRPPTATGGLTRSFLAFPSVLFIDGGLKKVHELYSAGPQTPQALSEAFVEGFEQFSWFTKAPLLAEFSKYIPRMNWRFSWDGIEKMFIFSSFAKRVSLEHSYVSTYTEGWRTTPEGLQQIQTQRVEYGFAPLAGVNITFNELWGGNFNSSIKYGSRSSYDLGISTSKITETFSRDIGITAGYSLSGVEIPLFGISLKNDIEFSFSYTNTRNSTVVFDMVQFNEDGTPQDGSTRVTIEPRAKYTLSSKVTLTLFYRRSSVEPEGAAKYPPSTTNEVGLDAHISIQ